MSVPRIALLTSLLCGAAALAGGSSGPSTEPATGPQIQWFGTWDAARAEAARTNRPILLTSAAPACQGVSGIW